MTKLASLLAVLFATAFLAAGCGGDDEGDSGSSTPAPATATDAAETPETVADETLTVDPAPEEDTGGAEVPDTVAEAVELCKDNIDASPQLNDDVKEQLKKLCDQAASGDAGDTQEIAKQACEAVVESSGLQGEQRETALQSCESAGQ